jgi:hypothetical protein
MVNNLRSEMQAGVSKDSRFWRARCFAYKTVRFEFRPTTDLARGDFDGFLPNGSPCPWPFSLPTRVWLVKAPLSYF